MTRPRGFTQWRPRGVSLDRLEAVKQVLIEYQEHLPLTCRQIFYRLVGLEVLDKSEKQYGALVELLGNARRGGVIAMDSIRDDGFSDLRITSGYDGVDDFLDVQRIQAKRYRRDRQAGQDWRIVVWCEAAGMVPQLERVVHPYGVTVKSSGGFDSLTAKNAVGRAWGSDGTVFVLHVGDYDPSGICMFDALREDVQAFARSYDNRIEFFRLAVTSAQITQYNLPTAPPKASSHQARKLMTETVQLEALPPDILSTIVKKSVVDLMDQKILDEVLTEEKKEREELIARMRS